MATSRLARQSQEVRQLRTQNAAQYDEDKSDDEADDKNDEDESEGPEDDGPCDADLLVKLLNFALRALVLS